MSKSYRCKSVFRILSYFFCLFCMTYMGNIAAAVNIDTALSAVEVGDFVKAYTQFKELAEQGDAEAQYNLAILFKSGKRVMQNPEKAAK